MMKFGKVLSDIREVGVFGVLRKRFGKGAVEFQVLSQGGEIETTGVSEVVEVGEKKKTVRGL